MARPENPEIGAIDDISGALSAIRESVAILAARWRGRFRAEDLAELDLMLSKCDAIQSYHLLLRAPLSRQYQRPEEASGCHQPRTQGH